MSSSPRSPRAAPPPSPDAPARPGLRERKKASTRLRISDIATRLFLERGFDEVTVAEVARAADVSVKTVFNYFGSKEDLLFDRVPEWLAAIEGLMAAPVPGRGLIPVLQDEVEQRWPALDFGRWDGWTDASADGRRPFYRLIHDHDGLSARRLQIAERIRTQFVAGAGAALDDPGGTQALVAGTLIHAAYDATGDEMVARLLAGDPASVVVERARTVGREALAVVARAYAGTPLVDGPPIT